MTRKDAFAALGRLIPGIWNRPGTIREMDELLTAAGISPDAPTEAEREGAPTAIGARGLALIKRFEGCRLDAYPDPGTGGDPWTVGWGATRIDGRAVRPGDRITQVKADAMLVADLARYAGEVTAALGPAIERTSQAQFDALVSFHYNTGAIRRATLTAKHRAGDFVGAAAEFGKWVNAGGRKMAGLVRRRAAERTLYEGRAA